MKTRERSIAGMVRAIAALLTVLLVAVMIVAVPDERAAAADGTVLKLHYHRADGKYDDWDVWLWEYEKDGAGYVFKDEGGEKVATMSVSAGTSKVGFIVRTTGWGQKDINEDQFIDISEVVSGTVHIYVESGVKGYTKEYGDDASVGVKLTGAVYKDERTISVTATADLDDPGKVLAVKGSTSADRSSVHAITAIAVTPKENHVYEMLVNEDIDLMGAYYVTFDGLDYPVRMPVLYSTEGFEQKYTYTGNDLGAVWSKSSTTFKLWAPTAASASVNLYETGEPDATDLLEKLAMTQGENGVWTATKQGDLNGTYYTYTVNVDGNDVEACDPYARTTGINGVRAMVIDLDSTDPEGWSKDKDPHAGARITDAVIYEGHIRDLTVNGESGIEHAGKYLGLAETGTKNAAGNATGIDHLKELGITHLHIMPMYDFGSVDETSATKKYNWGYDPQNYNVPEGSYSTDAHRGEVRVAEVKQMVKALHDNGISVVMDVVYNHVYSGAEFCFNKLVPGYFSRISGSGSYSNGSGCGNDTASERTMVRKYIVDSVCYWADEYHIDGFRFDLVGLLDVDTVNEIVQAVHKTHPNVIFYGEGWTMSTTVTKDDVVLATQVNSELTPDFAYFNDTIRDGIKGSVFDTGKGYVSGAAGSDAAIARCFLGADRWCQSPSQTINYASCHDNNTLYDRLKLSCKDASEEDIIRMNLLAASIYMTSEGVPFMSAGEEILRSKQNKDGTYDSNSYVSGDTINSIKWGKLADPVYASVFDYYKGLIAFRKEHALLRLATAQEVSEHVTQLEVGGSHALGFRLSGKVEGEPSDELLVYFNAGTEPVEVELPAGEWTICVDSQHAGVTELGKANGKVTVDRISSLVLVKGDLTDEGSAAGYIVAGGLCIIAAAVLLLLRRRRSSK